MWHSQPRGTDAAERRAGDPPSPTPAALGESRPGCSRHPGHRVRLSRKRWVARQEGNAHLRKLARQNRGHTAGAPAAGWGRHAAPVTAREALVDKADDTQAQGGRGRRDVDTPRTRRGVGGGPRREETSDAFRGLGRGRHAGRRGPALGDVSPKPSQPERGRKPRPNKADCPRTVGQ